MKPRLPITVAGAAAVLSLAISLGVAQSQRGGEQLISKAIPSNHAAEQALTEALTGPEGEYAAEALYQSVVQKFGEVLPYGMIVHSEANHANALKRHFEMRGLAVPENPYTKPMQLPATLKEAAELAILAEERNIAMYDRLLEAVKDQPDLARFFVHLQAASREHHLPAFKAAAAHDGQLVAGEFACPGMGIGAGKGPGGSPACAGNGWGCGRQTGCCGGCGTSGSAQGSAKMGQGNGPGRGWGAGRRFQGSRNP